MRWTESYTYIVDISMTYDHHQQIFIEIPIFGVFLLYSVTKPPSHTLKVRKHLPFPLYPFSMIYANLTDHFLLCVDKRMNPEMSTSVCLSTTYCR